MGDENSEIMNLDLNLGPTSSPDTELRSESLISVGSNLDESEHAGLRMRSMWWSNVRTVPFQARSTEMMVNLQTGEGSVPLEVRNADVVKECEKDTVHAGYESLGKGEEEEEEKGRGDEGSFFDCCICLDLSSDPVVTPCGHLFCWPCLYQWLNVHSDANECPVCKGEVTTKNLTPVFGRGSIPRGQDGETSPNIPDRPPARRVESWRQTIQRNSYAIPMEEMIRRLGSGFDFSRDLVEVQPQTVERLNESPERNRSLLNRILTSRAMRQEQQSATIVSPNGVTEIDLTQNTVGGANVEDSRVASYLRRSHTYRSAPTPDLANITQRLIESYIRYTSTDGIQDQPIPVDDRTSISSLAATVLLNPESPTLDTALEFDSRVSHSTSSSRRIVDSSRVSDRDSGDSRAHRRRRLN